jgi:hypothetical protein
LRGIAAIDWSVRSVKIRYVSQALDALVQESLKVAHQTGALAPKDLELVAVDTTVRRPSYKPASCT